MADKSDTGAYLPTPEEIAASCAEIRRGWSRREEMRRHLPLAYCRDQSKPQPIYVRGWTAPVVHVDAQLAAAVNTL